MRTVITISLNGNAYQIDAVGFDALRAYLQVAEQRLAGNPDQDEILADLEQAIADKCNRYLSPHKNVVSAGEITEVLREMGPVDGGASESQAQPGARDQQSAAGAEGAYVSGATSSGAAGANNTGPDAGATSSGSSSSSWAGGNGDAWAGVGAGAGTGAGAEVGSGSGLGGADLGVGSGAGAGFGAGAGTGADTGAWASNTASSGSATGTSGISSNNTPPLRRLDLIREGAAIAGVCKGLAAYLNIDVSVVRLLFIVLAILTGGVWILVYLVMMFVIPYAQTSEQHAAAHGWPFNAEELIARAKAHYAEFKRSTKWERQQWRAQQRMWKSQNKQWKQARREWERNGSTQGYPPPPPPPFTGMQPPPPPNTSYANQVLGGVFGPLADLVGALLFIAFLCALFSIVTHRHFFGWGLPFDVPRWMGIIFLIVIYQAVIAPLRRARYSAYYGSPFANGWWAVLGALVWIALVMGFAYQAWLHWDDILDFVQRFAGTLHDMIQPWHEMIERKAAGGPV
jgi:phage shock protein PspC (stress-responsive transcriptional regulator)